MKSATQLASVDHPCRCTRHSGINHRETGREHDKVLAHMTVHLSSGVTIGSPDDHQRLHHKDYYGRPNGGTPSIVGYCPCEEGHELRSRHVAAGL